ncbi:MAG: beta-ketoacyl-[acyl-carrier-protein] synthase II [Phycisphaerales bacterium]|nr:beta-ketoacyl-[acyl-carrier-protein] synthase II [Phycisphaerales bacterium]
MTLRRVVVTGLGALTPVGNSVAETWDGMVNGRSGIAPITLFNANEDWGVRFAGEVRGYDFGTILDVRESRRFDRFAMLALAAATEATADSGFDFQSGDPYRHGVAIGSGIGGIGTIEAGVTQMAVTGNRKIGPFTVPRLMVNAGAGQVSIRFNLRGANIATATACATGSHAIGAAFHMIQRGDADVMVAGGAEAAVTPLCIGAFAAMKALSTRNDAPTIASRPFDKDRDGFVLSEGAAVIVLEEYEHAVKRGAHIHAEILGFGSSGDAFHIAAPEDQGAGAHRAMVNALADAEVSAQRVGYINAHGTSTPLGDAAEVAAVKRLFGDHAHRLAMSSTKSVTGHALGAAGGIESIATILALKKGVLPPTMNLDCPDEGFDLDFVAHHAQERSITIAINNSFGFGGHNTSLVFGRFVD